MFDEAVKSSFVRLPDIAIFHRCRSTHPLGLQGLILTNGVHPNIKSVQFRKVIKGIYAGISPFGKAISALRFGLGTAHILQVCCAFLTSQALKSLLPNGEIITFLAGQFLLCASDSELLTYSKYAARSSPRRPIGKSLVNGFL